MQRGLKQLCIAAALVAGGTVFAVAQDSGSGGKYMSPYEYAASGQKAADLERKADEDSAGRVVGGTVAEDGAWPWQVGLIVGGMKVSAASQFCGGSLVLDNWVLTAAHCVRMPDQDGNMRDTPPDEINVFVGSNVLVPQKGDLIPVEAIYYHPQFDFGKIDFDIALIKLQRAPEGVDYKTITVPDAEFGEILDQPGVELVVTGWGLTDGRVDPITMYQADIQMMSRDACNATMLEARSEMAAPGYADAAGSFGLSDDDAMAIWQEMIEKSPPMFTANMLCSGTPEGGHGSCQGDSGGPLVAKLDDGSFVQAGIVSWTLVGDGQPVCLEEAQFAGYTKVSNFADWLQQTINNG